VVVVIYRLICICLNPVTSTLQVGGHTRVDIGVSANLELVDKFCYLGDMVSAHEDADTAVEARIWIGWNKFRQLVPLLTSKDVSLILRVRLYSRWSSMLHRSETWPVRKENEVAPWQFCRQRWEWSDGFVALR